MIWIVRFSHPGFNIHHSTLKIPARRLASRIRPCYIRVMTMQFQKIDPRVTISTPFGDIKIRFYPDDAPRHVENFLKLAKMGSMMERLSIALFPDSSFKAAIR